jgi:hypothetical protein
MKAETQGKLMVAMMVSILAFGSATGTALLMGYYQNPDQILNLTKPGEFPYIQIIRPNINNASNSQQNFVEPSPNYSTNPTNPSSNQQNNNTNST